MRRRSRTGGRPVKAQRRKTMTLKQGKAPKAARGPTASAAGQDTEVARLTRELNEASEQQTATSEVLRIISSTPSALEPVFRAILANATRICEAKFGNLWLREGDSFRIAATHGAPPKYREFFDREPVIFPDPRSGLGVIVRTKQLIHITDIKSASTYKDKMRNATIKLANARSLVAVPLLKDNEVGGAIAIYRQEVRPFTDKQIALVTNFAAQVVIAIENTRLLNELRQRTADLTEALDQQTATSEVLQVISSAPGELEPVFATMLEKAVRICDAKFGNIFRWHGGVFHLIATHNTPPAFAEVRRRLPLRTAPENLIGRMVTTKMVVHVADLAAEQAYIDQRSPQYVAAVELGGVRTFLAVPMLKENELVGAFILYREEVRPFTDKQIALVTSFAAQAVIAIENARLLNELRQRTTDLTEALEQQRATSDLLQVISGSPGNLEPVFQAMLENAVTICGANFGNMFLYENDAFRTVALYNAPEAYAKARMGRSFHPPPESGLSRLAATKEVIQTADVRAAEGYTNRDPFFVAAVELAGIRTLIAAPLLQEGHLIGAIVIYRQEVRPFSEKQIEVVKNFASQVVIAIENSRLLNELRDRTSELERSYALVQQQARQLEAQAQELEQRVADQVGEIERMGRLRRFLPPQVADLIVASGTEKQLESHRQEITALFCDLRGFTGFSESSDPEDVMALLRDYHAAIGEIITKYSGTLERYAGDGVMVVFNDPVPVDKPALQAVLMALEMRDVIGALTEKWRRLGHDIGFGIGIAHGFATLGTIGFEGRFDYAAIGTVSNVASRLCDEAKPGQILISPRVFMAVEDAVSVEPVGEFTLKGIRRPLAAYNVLATNREN
jgi:GAF domain-containing protein